MISSPAAEGAELWRREPRRRLPHDPARAEDLLLDLFARGLLPRAVDSGRPISRVSRPIFSGAALEAETRVVSNGGKASSEATQRHCIAGTLRGIDLSRCARPGHSRCPCGTTVEQASWRGTCLTRAVHKSLISCRGGDTFLQLFIVFIRWASRLPDSQITKSFFFMKKAPVWRFMTESLRMATGLLAPRRVGTSFQLLTTKSR